LYLHVKSFSCLSRTDLLLAKDSRNRDLVEPPASGAIVAIPQVGGLHYRDERRAAWAILDPVFIQE
jgi:hypothetical protein